MANKFEVKEREENKTHKSSLLVEFLTGIKFIENIEVTPHK
jgi:hypothetical protein